MAKRDKQSFVWKCVDGVLTIIGRDDGPMKGRSRRFDTTRYPLKVRNAIHDNGVKAIYQQRSSQIVGDESKLIFWDALDAMFASGTFELEGGARGAPIIGAWVEVLAEVKGVEVGAMQAALADYEPEQRAKIRANIEAKYADKIAEKKAARKDGIDLDDLL